MDHAAREPTRMSARAGAKNVEHLQNVTASGAVASLAFRRFCADEIVGWRPAHMTPWLVWT
jgi:hypothetical protein